MTLTVAITGPTGEIDLPLLDELEGRPEVGSVRAMARRPFDPAAEGWEKVSYRRGDILDRGSLAALFDGADVAVHLAFAIFGRREETRLVYTSSVVAYGFHADNPQPITEAVPARGIDGHGRRAPALRLDSTRVGRRLRHASLDGRNQGAPRAPAKRA
jgi:nucleoside-diphosphate-sugar epimerase